MPNHVKNRIKIVGTIKEVEEVFNRFNTHIPAKVDRSIENNIICESDNSYGWFNERTCVFSRRMEEDVIGIPEWFEIRVSQPIDCFPDFEKVIPTPENLFRGDLGEKERRECKKKGVPNWYDWCVENWETKWNCYSCKRETFNVFTFETAWSPVLKIVETMADEFPHIGFKYEWADEDTGYNCGKCSFLNGNKKLKVCENGSTDAYELAFKLRPDYRDYYELGDDGQYHLKED